MTKNLEVYIDKDTAVLQKIRDVDKLRGSGDFNNSLPKVAIKIPGSVAISCPLAKRTMIQAASCSACPNFMGVVQTSYNDEYAMLWSEKFAISCAAPTERKCISISINGVK